MATEERIDREGVLYKLWTTFGDNTFTIQQAAQAWGMSRTWARDMLHRHTNGFGGLKTVRLDHNFWSVEPAGRQPESCRTCGRPFDS